MDTGRRYNNMDTGRRYIIWIQGGDTEYGYREEIQNMDTGR